MESVIQDQILDRVLRYHKHTAKLVEVIEEMRGYLEVKAHPDWESSLQRKFLTFVSVQPDQDLCVTTCHRWYPLRSLSLDHAETDVGDAGNVSKGSTRRSLLRRLLHSRY